MRIRLGLPQLGGATVRQLAVDHGRDPASLRLVVRANAHVTDVSLASDRAPFDGSIPQITCEPRTRG